MKIMVTIKRVVDYNVRVQVKPDGSGVNLSGVKMSVNPFDEIALEEAVRMKESGQAEEIVAVTIGAQVCQEQLRTALAMGADRAIHVLTEEAVQPLLGARVLAKLIEQESPGLVLTGKQAIDDDYSQTAQMLAGLLDWPQAMFASDIQIEGQTAVVKREVDAGIETLSVDLPAVISADLRLNEPRYVKLPDIMKAKKKPIESMNLEDLGVEKPIQLEVLTTEPPAGRSAGVKVESVDALVEALKEKGVWS